MSLKTYESYKESGVEWLGMIPNEWAVDRLKWSIKSCKNGIWGEEANGDDNDIVCVRVADFNRDQLNVALEDPTIRNVTKKEQLTRLLKKGDLLLEKSGGGENQPVGCVALYDHDRPAVCSNFVAKIELANGMDPSFWRYFHSTAYSVRLNVASINQTSGIQNLDQDHYFDERVCFPSAVEQISIASFLDRETSKLDTLITKQEKLIELLQEKRQAIISHAVTKGLNPDAKMKDSEVEWLGMVPEDWEVKRLGYLTKKIGSGKTPLGGGDAYSSEGVMFIRSQNVYDDGLRLDDVVFISEKLDLEMLVSRVLPKDILLNITGASIGRSCIFPDAFAKANVNQHVCIIRMLDDSTSDYIALVMKSYSIKSQINFNQNGAGREGLNFPQIANLVIAMPPMSQQLEILKFINQKTSQIDMLINKASRSVELAKEHRTALISAVVTGKIDVREAA